MNQYQLHCTRRINVTTIEVNRQKSSRFLNLVFLVGGNPQHVLLFRKSDKFTSSGWRERPCNDELVIRQQAD